MAFATTEDVANRLGADLTDSQTTQATSVLELVALEIADSCGKPESWISTVGTVPPALKVISVEATIRVLHNPTGARSRQEQLGQFGHSESFKDSDGGALITEAEARRARHAVFGRSAGSVRVDSIVTDLDDLADQEDLTYDHGS